MLSKHIRAVTKDVCRHHLFRFIAWAHCLISAIQWVLCILKIIIVMCRRLDQGLTKFCMLCQTFGKQPVVQLIFPWHFQNLKHKADSSINMYNCLSYLIPVHLSYCISVLQDFFFMIVTRIAIMIMYRTLCVQYYAHRENSANHPSII